MKIHVRLWRWMNSAVFTGGPSWLVQRVWDKCWKMGCGKILFLYRSQEESTKQAEEEAANVSTSATHTYSKEEARCQSPYLSLLAESFPSWWFENARVSPGERVCLCVCVSKCELLWVLMKWHIYEYIKWPVIINHFLIYLSNTSLLSIYIYTVSRNEWDVVSVSAVPYEVPIPVLITAECWLTVCV